MITGFFGFDTCRSAVAADGSSPVNGVGPDSVPTPSPQTSVSVTSPACILFGSAVSNVTVGVVSDTKQLMGLTDARGKAITGRRPLVMQTTAATTVAPSTLANSPVVFGTIPAVGSTGGIASFMGGVRIKFTASDGATLSTTPVPVLYAACYNYANYIVQTPVLWYNPSTGTLYAGNGNATATNTYPLALGAEAYVEVKVSSAGGAMTVMVNGTVLGTSAGLGNYIGGVTFGTGGFVSGASDWFRVSICDIYSGTMSSGKYVAPLGNAIVSSSTLGSVSNNTFSVLPEGSTAEEAVDPSNSAYLQDTLTGASVEVSNANAIAPESGVIVSMSLSATLSTAGGPPRSATLVGKFGTTSATASASTAQGGGAIGLAVFSGEMAQASGVAAGYLDATLTTAAA